eukprot:26829_1
MTDVDEWNFKDDCTWKPEDIDFVIQFSSNHLDISKSNDKDGDTEISNNFFSTTFKATRTSNLQIKSMNLFSNKNNICNDETDSWFNLVYGYIVTIPLSKTIIIPMEIIQICCMYFIDKNIKYLIHLLTNVEIMQKYLTTINYDYQSNTSIKIDDVVIKQAYEIIDNVDKLRFVSDDELIDKLPLDSVKNCSLPPWILFKAEINALKKTYTSLAESLREKYYKLIPHLTTFSNGKDWAVEETLLIHSLSGVSSLLSDPNSVKCGLLKCNINTLPKSSEEYEIIENYVTLTHKEGIFMYSLQIENVYKLGNLHSKWKSNENRTLLWFGDRITNIADILINGLCLPPKEATDKAFQFGKDIYFSDKCTYATDKCCTTSEINIGFVLLCQVVLAETTIHGGVVSNPSTYMKLENGCVVPCCKRQRYRRDSYNQYVVSDPSQIKMEYLLQLKFTHKPWAKNGHI